MRDSTRTVHLTRSHIWTDLEGFKGLIDPSVIGISVLKFYCQTEDERYLEAAARQYEFLRGAPRTADGGIPQHKGGIELWVDTIYELCPFLSFYGEVTDNQETFDEAYTEAACRTIDVCTDVVDDDGAVHRVTGPPGDLRASLIITSYGQAWFPQDCCSTPVKTSIPGLMSIDV